MHRYLTVSIDITSLALMDVIMSVRASVSSEFIWSYH